MPTNHTVSQGECLSRIAARYGFRDFRRVYDHPLNAELRRKRPDPNLLYPGDIIVIPDKQEKKEQCSTEQLHRFVVPAPRRILRIALEDPDHNRLANMPYQLVVGDQTFRGTTDAQGMLEHPVPLNAEDGMLVTEKFEWPLQIAHLNPVPNSGDNGISGVQARLRNMGYDPGEIDGILGPKTRAAITAFQVHNDLEADGEPNAQTRAKLIEKHGC